MRYLRRSFQYGSLIHKCEKLPVAQIGGVGIGKVVTYPAGEMQRFVQTELLEGDGIPEVQVARAYHQLTRIHRYLGDTRAIVRAIRDDPLPVRRVLDVGCGRGGVLKDVQRRLGLE